MQEFITNNLEETKNLGFKIAKELKNGGIVALYGELGSGKTTFVQGFAKGLGIQKRILSPTFIIARTYEIKVKIQKSKSKSQNPKRFYHIDLYRIGNKNDVDGLGIDEILKDKANIIAIEWAEKLKDYLPQKRIDIYFEYLDEHRRKIKLDKVIR